MKKALVAVACAAMASAMVASAAEVLSQNAVGFVKRSVPAGKLQIVAFPFANMDSEDGTFKFGETDMAISDLKQGDSVMFWDAEKQVWNPGSKGAKGWAAAQSNHVIQVGEAFFVRNNSADEKDVTVTGEVPDDAMLSRSFSGSSALSIVADPFPVEQKFGTSELATSLPQGSSVMFWDAEKQVWNPGSKGAKGWAAAQSNYVVQVGEGFFVRTSAEGAWEATKPYTWP